MLNHGILGLLNFGDMSGCGICEVFKDLLNYFCAAQTSQIQSELGVLEKNGWIEKRTVEQDGKPNKHTCCIVEEGRKELLRWLSEPFADMDMRSPAFFNENLFCGRTADSEQHIFFKQLNEEYRIGVNELSQTDNLIRFYKGAVSHRKKALFWQMTADFGK